MERENRTASEGSGVMEACEAGRSVYDIAAGEHCSLTADSLALTIITTAVVFTRRHFFGGLPQLRMLVVSKGFEKVLWTIFVVIGREE